MTYLTATPLPIQHGHPLKIAGVIEGAAPFFLADLAKSHNTILYVVQDDQHLDQAKDFIAYTSPSTEILTFPAWDCLPYDRVSPRKDIIGQRLKTLQSLLEPAQDSRLIITTPAALLQRLTARTELLGDTLTLSTGQEITLNKIVDYLAKQGYQRVSTVREQGEFAVRGGIIDLFPLSENHPYRLDFFGDEIESIKTFDALTQRSKGSVKSLYLGGTHELHLRQDTIARFRTNYRERFGAHLQHDLLYKAISDARAYPGMEHWLPLFYESTETLFDYCGDQAVIVMSDSIQQAIQDRYDQIQDHYQARVEALSFLESKNPDPHLLYHPLSPHELYIEPETFNKLLSDRSWIQISGLKHADTDQDLSLKPLSILQSDAQNSKADTLKSYLQDQTQSGKQVHIFCQSEGSRQQLITQLQDRNFLKVQAVDSLAEGFHVKPKIVSFHKCPLDFGFTSETTIFLTEREIFGEIQRKIPKKAKRSDLFIAEASALQQGDYVVHEEHGIGQFDGLHTMLVDDIPHDCVKLLYAGGDKLFLPVENIELISRYGGEDSQAVLDKLGAIAWQARRAKVKKRLEDIANHLIDVAAARKVKQADTFSVDPSLYSEFVHKFPFTETDDQLNAISDVMDDLQKGQPMDRLVCGDVGFGKTEVALRAAFIVAASGKQVALIAPTTLLARQHYLNFKNRFEGFGLRVEQLSRMVTPKAAKQTKDALKSGQVDIVIGTHALLADTVKFKDLGMVIVDEEQHFGVKQKEKLKDLQRDIHVLTLTATPIPRTLQLSLTGVRDLSIIATPPVDRLTIRTFITPFDPVTIEEAIRRELNRNGQVFYVSPRLKDLQGLMDDLLKINPAYRIAVAHGQMPARDLEAVMDDFAAHKYDILLSTNIIESGIDLPTVNTLFVHRSDHFGLSQLYQLRGRIGRGKLRAYAYLTLPADRILSKTATKRLEVMQALDSLGAGFQIASHDMDIRGAGNLLGQEQSGHIKEVGVELYQHLLEEAVDKARAAKEAITKDTNESETWSPTLNLGVAVMIPEAYVSDLSVRMDLYRRLAHFTSQEEIDELGREMIDRFGPYPQEVDNVLRIISLKQQARRIGVSKIDVGAKGVVFKFYKDEFRNPMGLMTYVQNQQGVAKVRSDQSVFFMRKWTTLHDKFQGCQKLLSEIDAL